MPLFLYTIRDSGWAAVLVIFMSSLWPTLANTAFGVVNIKRDYLLVAAILQLSWWRRLMQVILPAAAPAIVAGLRISIGSAWRSEERRVGKECRSRGSPDHEKKKYKIWIRCR